MFSYMDIFILDTWIRLSTTSLLSAKPHMNAYRLALELSTLSQQLAITTHLKLLYTVNNTIWKLSKILLETVHIYIYIYAVSASRWRWLCKKASIHCKILNLLYCVTVNTTVCMGICLTNWQYASYIYPTQQHGFDPRSGHVGSVVDKVASLGQVSSEYLGIPCQFSFYQCSIIIYHLGLTQEANQHTKAMYGRACGNSRRAMHLCHEKYGRGNPMG
jgi:hypothetical protein